ncbi:MAG: TonB-dependent receptor [Spirosomataceae bacterium]|jgi:outer membrane receptor protein involved in Fe transport
MLQKLSFIFIGVLFAFSSFAHKGTLAGKVKDQKSGINVPGASISIKDHKLGTVSDEFGYFKISNLEPGKYWVEVSFVGYVSQNQFVEIKSDETTFIEFSLPEKQFELNEVKILASNPQKQQVISSLDIRTRTINNSQEVLRIIPGIVIGQHAGGGKAEQIFLRGFDIDHGTDIQLTVDGMPINMVSHAHGQGYADAHFIIPELIDKVDFKKGMYDTEKGNFSTAGWANFKTKSTLDQNFAKAEAGMFNTLRLVSGVNLLKKQDQNAYLATEYNYSDAYFDSPQKFNRLNIFGKYHDHISKNTNLTLTGSAFWSKWNASGQIPDRAVATGIIGFFGAIDPNEGGQTSRTNFNAELVTLTRNNHVWKNQLWFSNYNFELYSNFTFFLEDPENGDQIRQKENRNLFGYNSNYTISHHFGGNQSTFNLGLNYRQDLTKDSELSHTINREVLLNPMMLGDVNEANLGIYLDETVQLGSKLSATAGLRFDYFRNSYLDKLQQNKSANASASILSPKFNLYFTQNKNLQFYLNTGKGFHSNDTRAVVPQNGLEILPAAYGSDLGVILKPVPRMVLNAALWYLWLAQEFVYVGDAGVVEPSGKTQRSGVDVSVRYQIYKNLFADLDANWAKPRAIGEPEGENLIPLAVRFTSIGGITLKNESGWNGSLRYRYVADRPANEDGSVVAKGYFVSDGLVNYSWKNKSIGLSVQNIFNTKWKETQFATLSRLKNETNAVEEICFTPGTPFNARVVFSIIF